MQTNYRTVVINGGTDGGEPKCRLGGGQLNDELTGLY